MKWRFKFIHVLFFIFLLALPIQVFADPDHDHSPKDSPWLAGNDDADHDHGPDGSPWLTDGDHDHEYEEPGANVPLLGAFAVINGGFILFGAIRKYRKNKAL
ncbi:hypothetical protein RJD24_18980 [Bacillaceae bacterium IKA-2]|jgi:hypothetical protein|nr:hypothetical protein RJD24_18980 [Bacillaceae bacterium IKA-2]